MDVSSWKLQITFGRNEPKSVLTWEILSHPVALIWVKLFEESLLANRPLKSRFIGFTKGHRDSLFVGNLLNECIEVVNRDGRYHIKERFDKELDQKLLNAIHHHFSHLIGNEVFRSSYWLNSSVEVQSAVCGLNDYVHELESWDRAIECERNNPHKRVSYITSEFFEAPTFPMKEDWDKYFSLNGDFGDLCLHYDQIGKTWMEVLIDQDESIHVEDIRPLSLLTGSFNINFFETNEKDLLDSMSTHANRLGLNLKDPSLRLGQCCIGKFEGFSEKSNKNEIVDNIGAHMDISLIRLFREGKIIREKVIPPSMERYFLPKAKLSE